MAYSSLVKQNSDIIWGCGELIEACDEFEADYSVHRGACCLIKYACGNTQCAYDASYDYKKKQFVAFRIHVMALNRHVIASEAYCGHQYV